MEKITFYKLNSPYREDATANCKLTVEQLDQNFLTFKDYDVKNASYDAENMIITVNRNNGETIKIDISDISDKIDTKIEEAVSGITPSGSTQFDINIDGELLDDGTLVLSWSTPSGEYETEISGFLTEAQTEHDETIAGTGNDANPLRISNLEKTGKYKSVKAIVDVLPEEGMSVGDRYITKQSVSSFGRVYNKQGMELVKTALSSEESSWRVPTKGDWDKLLNYADACNEDAHNSYAIDEYLGNIAGKVLKSVEYWEGNENLDKFGFTAVPAGYVSDGSLGGNDEQARFWTNTSIISDTSKNYIKGLSYDHDNVLQEASEADGWYSIRLVRNVGKANVSDSSPILGTTYEVINIPDIKQAWIKTNLSFNPGYDYSEQYTYNHDGLVSERFVLNHWNGRFWEKKELNDGDEISVSEENKVTEYVCVVDEFGNQTLVKGNVFYVENKTRKLVFDAGWY